MINKKVLDRTEEIKDLFPEDPQCYMFASMLSHAFGGIIYYNGDHCISFIDGIYYDENGYMNSSKVIIGRYTPLSEHGIKIEMGLITAMVKVHYLPHVEVSSSGVNILPEQFGITRKP